MATWAARTKNTATWYYSRLRLGSGVLLKDMVAPMNRYTNITLNQFRKLTWSNRAKN